MNPRFPAGDQWASRSNQQQERPAVIWIIEIGRSLLAALTDGYRPELHYMRGPGPKWRAKHRPA
jgi:hypothetical protein